jgi:hypothetical protein
MPQPQNPHDPGTASASVERRLVELRRRHAIDVLPLANWRAATEGGAPADIAEGDAWPTGRGGVTFERHTVTIPAEWPLADVRLDLDIGGEAEVTLHSRYGPETHRIGPGGSALTPPTRAFGIRILARATEAEPRLGPTALRLVDPEFGAALARLQAEADPAARERALSAWELRTTTRPAGGVEPGTEGTPT